MWLVIVLGAMAGVHSIANLSPWKLDFGYLLIACITVGFASRIIVDIPRCKGQISVSDTFVLLSLLLYGTEAAVLLAGADALASCLRVNKKKINIAYNTAVFICSTFLTGMTLKLFFGSITALSGQDFSPAFLLALTVMGLVQYGANSGFVAIVVALQAGEPIWKMWREKFLWTSLTYFAGSFAAGIIVKLSIAIGLFALLATTPIIAIIYFTYSTYLKNVEAAAKQAELARSHVEELSKHIAEQERISSALKESEEHFRTAFDHAVGMALVSPDGHWLEVNESLSNLIGYSQDELRRMSFRTIIHADDLGLTLVKIQELVEGVITSFQLENRYIHKQGQSIWGLSSASLVRDESGNARHMVFQVQNISDRKQAEDQVRYAAFHDGLTGLPNRTLLSDRMSRAVERANKISDYNFAVLFIDLDRFKVVNDTMGHEMGDKLLVDLSNRLKECVRAVDTLARLGGDEFAILLDHITDPKLALEIAERIQSSLSQPFDLDGQEFFTSASIGISFSALGYESPEDILRDADTAMYRAKANGKARHEVFDLGMHTRAVESLKLENDLRQGIERGEIHAYYQPIMSLQDDSISGFEALARWEHPERGLISPVDFITLAEETGLIVPLGMKILKDSCRQLRDWQLKYRTEKPLTMSINLSGKQFAQKDMVEEIRKVIRNAELDPECIRLEITESIVIENASAASDTLRQLKAIGVRLSIDDFGTGYSSLSYLHRFPFDILKIDRSFVSRMNTDKDSLSIVETIITLAQKLGKAVVAEGVETERHKNILTELLCDYAQGYLFSKPLNRFDAEKLLENVSVSANDGAPGLKTISPIEVEAVTNQYAM